MLRYSALRSAKNSIVFDVDLAGVRCLVAIFLWVFRLPQSFCFRDQALQYHALVLVGLFRKQLSEDCLVVVGEVAGGIRYRPPAGRSERM